MSAMNTKLGSEGMGRYLEVRGCLAEGKKRGVQWLETQSTVLEEIDQLVELMAEEKEAMSQEISKLKGDRKRMLEIENVLKAENTQLKLENINKQTMLDAQEEQSDKMRGALKDAVETTRRQLDQTRCEVNSLNTSLSRLKERCKALTTENCELKEKAQAFKSDCSDMATALELHRSENCKLKGSLSTLRDQSRKQLIDINFLKAREKELEERLKIGEDTILAMKGRANSSRKMEEQLKAKCASLEQALELTSSRPVVCKMPNEKTRVELELIRECKKKEQALIDCSNQLSASQMEEKKQRLQRNKLERSLNSERRKNCRLTRDMQNLIKEHEMEVKGLKDNLEETKELRRKLRRSLTDLKVARRKEMEFNAGKEEVEMSLFGIEDELMKSQREIENMKLELEEKQRQWWEEKQQMEREKLKLIKAHSKQISELEAKCCLEDIQCPVKDRADVTAEMLADAKEDYKRLKEASTKRCTELAKEVWHLKSQVADLEDSHLHHHHHHHHQQHHHGHHQTSCYDSTSTSPTVCIEDL